ncbi:MAG TPA: penicillin-binding protein activator LpoB [Sedimentisphaerales bacterium]|nr:penicillin-binding protein activator LpoB [Sedimentisphaerales bacterium]
MKTIFTLVVFSILFVLTGCVQETKNIDMTNDNAKAVLALDYRDFDQAATEMVQSLLSSGKLAKPEGGQYVLTTGVITNDTMQRIDTDLLTAKIEEDITNSGQVVMTSAIGGKDSNRDSMVNDLRDVRDSAKGEEFQQDTLPNKGTLIAPDLSLSGKIYQRNLSYDKKTQQVEYYFQLKITDLKSGLRFWQKEVLIGKRGSNKAVAW